MGEIVGYVSRARGAPFLDVFGATPSGVPQNSISSFVASMKDGRIVGDDFPTVAEAQDAVRRTNGSDLLQWSRTPLTGNRIERYQGESPFLYPGDLRGLLDGGAWWRGDQGARKIRSAGDVIVPLWSSFETGTPRANASSAVAATTPIFSADGANGRPTLVFDATDLEFLPTNLIGVLPPPLTVMVLARYVSAGRRQVVLQSDGGFEIAVSAGGDWEVTSGVTVFNLGAPSADLQLVSAIITATDTTVFLNGVASGTAATVPVLGDWEISDAANAWHRELPEALIIPSAINTNLHAQLVSYFSRRYQLSF